MVLIADIIGSFMHRRAKIDMVNLKIHGVNSFRVSYTAEIVQMARIC